MCIKTQMWNVFKSVKANNQLPGTRWLQRAPCRRRLLNQSYSGGNDASCISLSSYVIFIILLSFWVFPQDVLNQSYSGGNDASFISLKFSSRYSARLTSSSNIKIRGAPLNINVTSKLDLGKGANFSVSSPFPEQGLRAVYRLAGAQQHCSVVFKDHNIRQSKTCLIFWSLDTTLQIIHMSIVVPFTVELWKSTKAAWLRCYSQLCLKSKNFGSKVLTLV